jgi:hypothetical protein
MNVSLLAVCVCVCVCVIYSCTIYISVFTNIAISKASSSLVEQLLRLSLYKEILFIFRNGLLIFTATKVDNYSLRDSNTISTFNNTISISLRLFISYAVLHL